MERQIIHIDEEKCNGCGLCATACHEGAIDIIDGKAKLVREHFCDGFGDCLPNCPTGAITFETREAPAYDEAAVQENKVRLAQQQAIDNLKAHMEKMKKEHGEMPKPQFGGCPGSRFMQLKHDNEHDNINSQAQAAGAAAPASNAAQNGHGLGAADAQAAASASARPVSRLMQWPCQIKLLPVQAPFYDGAKLLIAADCTAYAYANMHEEFMKGKVTMIGCPKLDEGDYSEKLTDIIASNEIKSVTIVRMEVPCCGGLQRAAETALRNSGKFIPWQVVTISRDGRILED